MELDNTLGTLTLLKSYQLAIALKVSLCSSRIAPRILLLTVTVLVALRACIRDFQHGHQSQHWYHAFASMRQQSPQDCRLDRSLRH